MAAFSFVKTVSLTSLSLHKYSSCVSALALFYKLPFFSLQLPLCLPVLLYLAALYHVLLISFLL